MPQATPFLWDSLMYNPHQILPVLSGFVRYVITEDTPLIGLKADQFRHPLDLKQPGSQADTWH